VQSVVAASYVDKCHLYSDTKLDKGPHRYHYLGLVRRLVLVQMRGILEEWMKEKEDVEKNTLI